jgi:2-polyprenyl-6-hydroxyphenyl methylase/3-demethylubiquinone-9 3-methyltransferase
MYLDMDAFVALLRRWSPDPAQILEVGCGEGAMTKRLAVAYPNARIIAIDVTSRVGRLYEGRRARVEFLQSDVQTVAVGNPGRFDLVILADVLHHVPAALRSGLMLAIRSALAPAACFVFKDWERSFAPIHWCCHASDRWLTGDRISYLSAEEMRRRLAENFGPAALAAEERVPPWRNNVAMLVRP